MDKPTFVDSDPITILNEIVDDFQNLTGRTISESQPEHAICRCLAYHKSLTLNRVNAAGASMLVDYSTYPVLDYLAASYDIIRLEATPAVCNLHFVLVTGHLQVTIPAGTRVISTDGNVTFETIEDTTIEVGTDEVDITAQCQTTGDEGNDYGVGAISVLQDIYAYISEVANTNITSGGADEETDEQLRSRVKLATSKFSVAGSTNAYIFWAKSASPLIVDVAVSTFSDFMPITTYDAWVTGTTYSIGDVVTSSGAFFICVKTLTSTVDPVLDSENWLTTGQVDIYALLSDGELPSSALNTVIEETLNAENIRPLTDNVVVKTAVDAEYELEIDIVKKSSASSSLQTNIESLVNTYIIQKRQLLGQDIVASEIEKICRIDGVYDATVTIVPTTGVLTGRNLIVSPREVAKGTSLTVTITDTNNG